MVKEAITNTPVIDIIRKRWSARSFTAQPLTQSDMDTLLEAASWAASANNEQPWQYYYAFNGTEGFDSLANGLLPGNQPWAKNAAVLLVTVARKSFEASGKPNPLALHDLGMANAQLMLQARSMDIYSHPMAGYDRHIIHTIIGLNDNQESVCMIALGYLDEADKLEEPFKTREITPRVRKPLSEIATRL